MAERNPIEDVFAGLEGMSPEQLGADAILSIIQLPDKEFELMSELFLNEMEKGLSSVEDKLLLVQGMNMSGARVEDLVKNFEQISQALDEQLSSTFPASRIDFIKRVMGLVINAVSETDGVAKQIVNVAIELCNSNAKVPKYAHAGDAGMDVYAVDDFQVKPGETLIVPTGLKTAIPLGYELQVRPRSGLSIKTKMRVANSPGTIDCNYRDEIGVIIENIEPRVKDLEFEEVTLDNKFDHYKVKSIEYGKDFIIGKGERFAQLVLSEVSTCLFFEVESVKEIGEDRGGGFGSSDI